MVCFCHWFSLFIGGCGMTYRKYYWGQFKEQLELTWLILWHGVIRNEGRHTNWGKGWFYGNKK
jgi:hypothetical protein